jgi:hypothetical protein
MKDKFHNQKSALRSALPAAGVVHLHRAVSIQLLVLAIALTGRGAELVIGSDRTGILRLTAQLQSTAVDTNTPAMREAVRIQSDLQDLVGKIQMAVDAARTANRVSMTNYAAELDRIASLVAETAQKKLGDDGDLMKGSSDLLKGIEKELDGLLAKSRDTRDPACAFYEKLIPALKAERDTLRKTQGLVGNCREELLAEAKRLRSFSALLATAARVHQLHNAVEAFVVALKGTTDFTSRLKVSIDTLLADVAVAPVPVD